MFLARGVCVGAWGGRYSWNVPETGVEEDGWLEGVLEMPMACGTVGGAVPTPVNISTTACQIQTGWSPH
eukprot:COSAG06_NODE_1403_length_9565_cov_3.285231_1_plen_68_part_10